MNKTDAANIIACFEPEILLSQIKAFGEIGMDSDPALGRTRLTLGKADKIARDTLVSWTKELDMEVHIDVVGNIFGVVPGKDENGPVMCGSHIDTVEKAGPLDGVYGVLSALAVARAIKKSGITPARSFIVAAFTNEEGARFQPDMLGSLVYVGGMDPKEVSDIIGTDGKRFGDELEAIGYNGNLPPRHFLPAAYFELHIEQGPVLESKGKQIGIVKGVQGIFWQKVTITGQANHAGAFPTKMRHDAGLAAARLTLALRDISEKSGTTLTTVGSMTLEPNVINVIPGRAELTVDMRDPDGGKLKQAEAMLVNTMQEVSLKDGVQIATRKLADFPPTPFDEEMLGLIEKVCSEYQYSSMRMVSGAGHDAQMLARICPVGMIFVPSIGGYSHCPEENTAPEDLERGAKVLLATVVKQMGLLSK